MKPFICTFLIGLIVTFTQSLQCAVAGSVSFTPNLDPGITYLLKIHKTTIEEAKNGPEKKSSTRESIKIRVESVSPDGFFLRVQTLLDLPDEQASQTSQAEISELIDLLNKFHLLLKFNANYEYENWINADEMHPVYLRIIDIITNLDKSSSPQVKQAIRSLSNNRNYVESLYTKNISLMTNWLLWREYETGTYYEYESLLPNPFGGAPLNSEGILAVTELGNNAYEISLEDKPSPESLKKFLLDSIRLLAGHVNSDADNAKATQSVEGFGLLDRVTYSISGGKNWPSNIYHERIINTQNNNKVISIKIEITPETQ